MNGLNLATVSLLLVLGWQLPCGLCLRLVANASPDNPAATSSADGNF